MSPINLKYNANRNLTVYETLFFWGGGIQTNYKIIRIINIKPTILILNIEVQNQL